MKFKKYILISVLALFLFNSCEYEIDYKGDLPKDKLVIGSFIEADSIISISLFRSAKPGTYFQEPLFGEDGPRGNRQGDQDQGFVEKDSTSYIRNARAELYINSSLRETLNSATYSNQYKFQTLPKANDNVEIKISYQDYAEAIGTANLNLLKPKIDSSAILVQESIDTQEKIYRVVLYLEISDNGMENYYQIEPNLYYKFMESKYKLSLNDAELISENIPGVYQENTTNMQSSSNRFGVFSNKKFRGGTYKLELGIALESRLIIIPNKNTKQLIGNLTLSIIDKKSYDYLFTLNRYYNSSFMNEPVIILDGVENAYGFIGAKSTIKANSINFSF